MPIDYVVMDAKNALVHFKRNNEALAKALERMITACEILELENNSLKTLVEDLKKTADRNTFGPRCVVSRAELLGQTQGQKAQSSDSSKCNLVE